MTDLPFHEINRRKNIEENLLKRGRKVEDWWDGEPVHRPITIAEKMKMSGIDPAVGALALALLGNRNYKPTFPIDEPKK